MNRKNVSSGSPMEKPIGFSRASRIGNIIAVAGTAPIGPEGTVGGGYKKKKSDKILFIHLFIIL